MTPQTVSDLRVTLLPMPIEWGRKEKNLRALQEAITLLPSDTDLLVLPETFSTGFPSGQERNEIRLLAESMEGDTLKQLKSISASRGCAIAGSFICHDEGRLLNRGFFIRPDGNIDFADKRHLFTMGGEDRIFSRGHSRLTVSYRGWRISLAICYDLRFPVWLRNNPAEPYDLLLVVANWPSVRRDAWEKLIYARAIENAAYVAAVDCLGTDPTGHFYDGTSIVADYKGKALEAFSARVPDEGFHALSCVLSKQRLDDFRRSFPVLDDAD